MKYLLAIALLFCVGCNDVYDFDPYAWEQPSEVPQVNIPRGARQSNWLRNGEGSCVHASLISLFRWQCQPALADWWKANHGGGEYPERTMMYLDRAGIPYANTLKQNDVAFLEWACRTRRGAAVAVMGARHMVDIVHIDSEWVGILDNNFTEKITFVPRAEFLSEWFASGSWAITPLLPPPLPVQVQ